MNGGAFVRALLAGPARPRPVPVLPPPPPGWDGAR